MVYLPKYTYSMQDGNAAHSIIPIGMKRGWQWFSLLTIDFMLPKKSAASFSNKWSCDITTSESISTQWRFIEHFFIATQQRGISYLLTSYVIHHFSIHNSYFTRRPLMLSWSIWSYQSPRREGCYRWVIPQSNNRRSMESLIMVSPTLSSSSQQTWSNDNLWLCILFAFAMITQY